MKKTNILIVMTDHQRADTVLPENPTITPNLDKFSSDGIIFTNAYCPTAHCCPARASFFSGLYPSGHGIWNNVLNSMAINKNLTKGVKLWSEDLASSGYKMFFTGKWHVDADETPVDRGWKEFFVSCMKGQKHGCSWERYEEIKKNESQEAPRKEGEIIRPGYGNVVRYGCQERTENDHDEKVVNDAVNILSGMNEKAGPWCLYAGFTGPHDPYMVPQKYLNMYNVEDIKLPESFKDDLSDKPYIYKRMRNQIFDQFSEYEQRQAIRHFMAYCSYLDDCFGKILNALERSGQAENTLVLYISDHGDYCGEHGLFAKGVPAFKGAYNVPAVIRWPSGIENPGHRVNKLVLLCDFAPTFLELANCKIDRHFSGSSIVPFLKSEGAENWRDAVFTQFNGVELYYSQRSVITEKFRYTFNGFDRDELYDLERDPHEMRNLADFPEYEEIKKELCRQMWAFARKEGDPMINNYITVGLAPLGPASFS
ncbi:MAG: hypothetical protein A2017_17070 [Lentisphaerae bacterium GWF2_44_16]|nr:MAG: hypothetical protein A2017_17070 [Lentisphaerae bacterium GWF2_44_16]